MRLLFAAVFLLPFSSTAPLQANERNPDNFAAAFSSCVTSGIRSLDDGKQDARWVVDAAEARCLRERSAFASEFQADPESYCRHRERVGTKRPTRLADPAFAKCFGAYMQLQTERRIARLTAYRENNVTY